MEIYKNKRIKSYKLGEGITKWKKGAIKGDPQISALRNHLSEWRVGACRWEPQEVSMVMALGNWSFAWIPGWMKYLCLNLRKVVKLFQFYFSSITLAALLSTLRRSRIMWRPNIDEDGDLRSKQVSVLFLVTLLLGISNLMLGHVWLPLFLTPNVFFQVTFPPGPQPMLLS